VPVAGAGAVNDGFDREGFVVAGVEGELPGGPFDGRRASARRAMLRTRARWSTREAYTA
jgi:hypothetical protein